MVAAAAGLQHAARHVHEQPDVRPGVCLKRPCGALQPPLGLGKLTRPHHRAGQRYQRGRDPRLRAPSMSLGKRDRLAAAPLDSGEREDLRREPQLREASDLEVGPADLTGQDSALPQVALDRKSTRLNSSHITISYAVFCLKKKKNITKQKQSNIKKT